MVTLEKVEKLREYANITYDEAKKALENADGDILQALIDLEHQGKMKAPQGGGQYVSYSEKLQNQTQNEDSHVKKSKQAKDGSTEPSAFKENLNRFFRWVCRVIHKGNINSLLVEKNGEHIIKLPVTALVLLLVFAFWIVIPLFIVGLFFNFRYSFDGPDLGCTKVNNAMDTVAKAAEDIKNDIRK